MTLPPENIDSKITPARAIETGKPSARWGLFLFSVALFVVSLVLVKEGARPLGVFVRDIISVDSPWSALGFGWLLATVILSGSPVAATALVFLDAGVLSVPETFLMVAGSRLGAAMIVLLVGFAYTLRGSHRESSLGAGIISLLVTQTIYIPALTVGYLLLTQGWFNDLQMTTPQGTTSMLDRVLDPAIAGLTTSLPPIGLFLVGFGLMLVSFWLFDRSLPEFGLRQSSLGQVNRLLYRPFVSFAMGAVLTALTMSVSVSLGLLVPLSARGYIRQENAIPYIMGANITTFIDTLLAAALLANPMAIGVVLVQMLSVALVSLVILVAGFSAYERLLSNLASTIADRQGWLGVYLAATLLIPIALLVLS
jgi:sodium-dependent phosphate cotransporter